MAKKTNERYKCEQCGLVVLVEDPCACEPCDLICCSVPMKPIEKKALPKASAKPKAAKKVAVKPKPKEKK